MILLPRQKSRHAKRDTRTRLAWVVAFGVAFTMALGLVFPGSSAWAAPTRPCGHSHADQARVKTHLPCLKNGTPPQLKRCVAGTAGAMLVGGIFAFPFGILAGFSSGVVGCATNLL